MYYPSAVSYAKTVAIAVGLCFLALIAWSVIWALYSLPRESGATGIAVVGSGLVEALLASVLGGWLIGTTWYFIRRR